MTRALSRCAVAAVLAIGIALTPAPGAHAAPGDLTFVGCVQAATTQGCTALGHGFGTTLGMTSAPDGSVYVAYADGVARFT